MQRATLIFQLDFIEALIKEFQMIEKNGTRHYPSIKTSGLYEIIKSYLPETMFPAQFTFMIKNWFGIEVVRHPDGRYFKIGMDSLVKLLDIKTAMNKETYSVVQWNGTAGTVVVLDQNMWQLLGFPTKVSGSDAKDISTKAAAPDKNSWGVDHSKDKELLELGTIPEIQEEELLPVEEITGKIKPSTTTARLQQKRQESL
jgi:hypothetical protein